MKEGEAAVRRRMGKRVIMGKRSKEGKEERLPEVTKRKGRHNKKE